MHADVLWIACSTCVVVKVLVGTVVVEGALVTMYPPLTPGPSKAATVDKRAMNTPMHCSTASGLPTAFHSQLTAKQRPLFRKCFLGPQEHVHQPPPSPAPLHWSWLMSVLCKYGSVATFISMVCSRPEGKTARAGDATPSLFVTRWY